MGKYFGTDGIRGVANEKLTPELALKVGEYLGYRFKGQKIIVGKDTRLSGSMLEHAIATGAASTGTDVYLLGLCATPALAYVLRAKGFAGGVMISASHNPYMDNGLKCFNSEGMKIDDALENEIERYIDGEVTVPYAKADEIGEIFNYHDGLETYIQYVEDAIKYRLDGYKIVLDLANGSAVSSAERLFKDLGADVVVMNSKPDGININVESGSTHMEGILKRVVEEKADMGFAFDGDADRTLAVDHFGNFIDGDKILYLLGNELREHNALNKTTVVSTIMANLGFLKSMDALGISVVRTDVGDKHVFRSMAENAYQLGGEQSGHIILSDYATTGDGVLTALKCAEAIARQKTSMYDLTKDCKEFPQVLQNIRVTSKDEIMNHNVVINKVKEIEEVLGTEGRILVRPSGTEPLVRVMVEAQTVEICQLHVDEMIALIQTL